ncbi:TVP38/TMEM64 family protein [Enterococcus cecorum]|uniref:TVP38/TMEM64 family protein n=1 Tax=Enterococcus cecorum TaxID=44008 RepID=UPI0032C44860
MNIELSRKIVSFISFCGLVATIIVTIYFYRLGLFKDIHSLRLYIENAAIFGPFIFILLQIIQVVVPIIPGGISTAAGVVIFGPFWGFVYNYVGICIGSVIVFLLARKYGKPFILSMISEKTFNKYTHLLDNQKRFDRLFSLAILLPVAPDDALCMIAGLTEISLKKFTWIILLCKPATILAYSMALIYGANWLTNLLS